MSTPINLGKYFQLMEIIACVASKMGRKMETIALENRGNCEASATIFRELSVFVLKHASCFEFKLSAEEYCDVH